MKRSQVTANDHCVKLINDLYTSNPGHPIFNKKEKGKLCMPIEDWRKKFSKLFDAKYLIGDNVCWMRQPSIQITRQVDSKTERLLTITLVRVLAFLVEPIDDNWAKVTSFNPLQSPFDHRCGRGQPITNGGNVCCNGIEHGTFSTRNDNEDRKKCTYGCLALCPSWTWTKYDQMYFYTS